MRQISLSTTIAAVLMQLTYALMSFATNATVLVIIVKSARRTLRQPIGYAKISYHNLSHDSSWPSRLKTSKTLKKCASQAS